MGNTNKGRETTHKKKQESNLLSTNPKENNYTSIIIKTSNILNKERILKAVREKGQVTERQTYQN